MPTALDVRGQAAPTEKPDPTALPPPRGLRLTRDVAKHLGRYVPAVTAKLRAELDTHQGPSDAVEPIELDIDLSDATEVPQSQLALLLTLLRRTIGNGRTITLSGVRPMVLNSLTTHGLPDDILVVDTRGRRWTNSH